MTKEITKANILQELQDKFKLRELIAEKFAFSELVVPVYEIGSHLIRGVVEYAEVSITSAPQGYLFFTVPQNEKWSFRRYNIIFMSSGAHTLTGVYARRATDDIIYLDMTLGQSASYAVNLPEPVTLYPGDRIYVYADSYTSTANLRLYIDLEKEEMR